MKSRISIARMLLSPNTLVYYVDEEILTYATDSGLSVDSAGADGYHMSIKARICGSFFECGGTQGRPSPWHWSCHSDNTRHS